MTALAVGFADALPGVFVIVLNNAVRCATGYLIRRTAGFGTGTDVG